MDDEKEIQVDDEKDDLGASSDWWDEQIDEDGEFDWSDF